MKCVILPPFPPFYLLWLLVLERYFSLAGQESELVPPKNLDLQKKLQRGPPKDIDFFSEEFEG
jgi:putative Holliday junction resolvase